MMFLRVENKVRHIPDVDFLCTMGESTSRGNANSIGQFGSGFIYTLALFARHGILPACKICLGKDVYTPFVESSIKKDGTGCAREINKIGLKKQNGGKYDLNISTGLGEIEWIDITMGVREIISNAFDGAETYDGTYNSVDITQVQENQCRAADGVVRIYIPITPEIDDYISNIDQYFLCIRKNYNNNVRVIPKSGIGPCRIYRKGVLVSQFGTNSLFNYNLPDIPITESRVINSNQAKDYCGHALLVHSRDDQLDKFVRTILLGENTDDNIWENTLTQWNLTPEYMHDTKIAQERLNKSIERVLGIGVLCSNEMEREMIKSKGLHGVIVKKEMYSVLARSNVKKSSDILNDLEALGHTIIPPTDRVNEVLDKVWNKLASLNLTNGRVKPPVACFNSALNASTKTLGYCSAEFDKIYIHQDIANDNGNQLDTVMLEELGHYATKARDCTRDFQTFFIGLAARLMNN